MSTETQDKTQRGVESSAGNGKLNPKQELFCQLYATDREFFGNGVQAYIEAYEPDQSQKNWYKTACACAARLLTNAKVCERINTLLEEGGLNDQFVDKQLAFLITQHADFGTKMSAIREYNGLKKRITKKLQLGNDPDNPLTQPDDALRAEFADFLKARK